MGEPGRAPTYASLIAITALVCLVFAAPASAGNSSFKPSAHVRALQRAAGAGVPTQKSSSPRRTTRGSSPPVTAPKSFQPLTSPSSRLAKPAKRKHHKKHHKQHKKHTAASTYTPPRTTTDTPEKRTFVTKVLHQVPTGVWIGLLVLAALAGALAAGSIVSTARARRLRRQREMLRADVGLLQSALLPAVPAEIAGVRVSAAYRPAGGPAAGGDFYDLFPLAG
jgi:hypothetical protein